MMVGDMVMMVTVMVIMVGFMVMMVGDHQYRYRCMTLSVRGTVTVIMMVGCVLAHPEAVAPCCQGTGT